MRSVAFVIVIVVALAGVCGAQVPSSNWGNTVIVNLSGTGTALDAGPVTLTATGGDVWSFTASDGANVQMAGDSNPLPWNGVDSLAVYAADGSQAVAQGVYDSGLGVYTSPGVSVAADGIVTLPSGLGAFVNAGTDLSGTVWGSGSAVDTAAASVAGVDTTASGSVANWLANGSPSSANPDGSAAGGGSGMGAGALAAVGMGATAALGWLTAEGHEWILVGVPLIVGLTLLVAFVHSLTRNLSGAVKPPPLPHGRSPVLRRERVRPSGRNKSFKSFKGS